MSPETTLEISDRTHRCVVTRSASFHDKQSPGFAQTLAKASGELAQLERRPAGGRSRRNRREVAAD